MGFLKGDKKFANFASFVNWSTEHAPRGRFFVRKTHRDGSITVFVDVRPIR